jgi:GDPmannose 4,6-dehydratase
MKRAFITGILGQDGIHLSKFLLSKDYKIFGLVNGQKNHKFESFSQTFPSIQLISGDLSDFSSLLSAIQVARPNEIYNLGSISYVGMSFEQPEITANVTGLGTLRILEAIRKAGLSDSVRFYQASSSEMFGKVSQTPQNEYTNFYPRSPYGAAKTFAHFTSINYREAYNMHVSLGILFNHEGEYRGHEFVTRKITSNVARIKLGIQKKFSLGSLEPIRDWGYAGEYVDAMWRMTQLEKSDTFVIATGQTHSVKEFLEKTLTKADLNGPIEKYVDFDSNQIRPTEVDVLRGDFSKAKELLNWSPKVNLDSLIDIMLENDLRIEKSKTL